MKDQTDSLGGLELLGALPRKQAAKYCGFSTRYLDKQVADGKLKRCRIGSKPVFRKVDLDAFLEACLEPESGVQS